MRASSKPSAMISSEVQRTLVKSPPELWAELSDPESLERHLAELGEIRITRAEPEKAVEWEAQAAKGRIELKQSGWGTKVTLTVTREAPEAGEVPVPEPEPMPEPEPTPEPQPAPMPAPDPAQVPEPEPEPVPEPRLGFFARLFKRRSSPKLAPEPRSRPKSAPEPRDRPNAEELAARQAAAEEAIAAQQAAVQEELAVERTAADEAIAAEQAATADEAAEETAAGKAAAEAEIAARTTELLTAVLDRLGAAHHRPFSRA